MGQVASYSRDQERESDSLGQGLAAAAGYDPDGMARFPEVYDPADQSMTTLGNAGLSIPFYPFNFVLPDGRVVPCLLTHAQPAALEVPTAGALAAFHALEQPTGMSRSTRIAQRGNEELRGPSARRHVVRYLWQNAAHRYRYCGLCGNGSDRRLDR